MRAGEMAGGPVSGRASSVTSVRVPPAGRSMPAPPPPGQHRTHPRTAAPQPLRPATSSPTRRPLLQLWVGWPTGASMSDIEQLPNLLLDTLVSELSPLSRYALRNSARRLRSHSGPRTCLNSSPRPILAARRGITAAGIPHIPSLYNRPRYPFSRVPVYHTAGECLNSMGCDRGGC
jgi:hypothetical protein